MINYLTNENLYSMPKYLLLISMLFLYTFSLTAQEKGTITGKIVDAQNGEELIGANILLEGTNIGAASDIEGNFFINNVPAGTYSLVASMIGYSKLTVKGVEVKPGTSVKLDITLQEEAIETEEVVITADLILNTEAGLLKNRQKSISVSDAISSEQISKSGAGDAGDAMKKVVGTSVVDGKYVYVRGLGERYSSTQLNGTELPSSDPNKKAFQLDLIPTNLLDNIVTIKTFTPDKPGNFSGGIVDIGTKTFPGYFTLKLSANTSYNTQTTLNNNYLTYTGGQTDWLGIDDGSRSIPSFFQNGNRDLPTVVEARLDDEKALLLNNASESFNNIMSVGRSTAPINSSYSLSIGNRIQTGDESTFGYLGSLTYSRSFDFYENGEVGRYTLSDQNANELNPQLLLNDNRGKTEANWGGLLTGAYNFNAEHQIGGNIFYSRSGLATSRLMAGKWPQELGSGSDAPDYYNEALQWVERDILSYQLRGEHYLSGIFGSTIDWSFSNSRTKQDEPDFRLLTYYRTIRPQDTSYTIVGSNFDDPSRYYRNLTDHSNSYNLNIAIPFAQWDGLTSKFKFGGLYNISDREFDERIFSYSLNNGIFNQIDGNLSKMFSDEYMGITDTTVLPDGRNRYLFGNTIYDRSFPKNNYTGDQEITAFYGMVELPIFRNFKFIGGARLEQTTITVKSEDETLEEGSIDETDILPSLNFIYNLSENMNLRLAATQTLARPTFRELAPYSTKDFVNDVELQGNPELERTLIQNYDIRWEWFMRPGEILAVSGFYKKMKNPIEISFFPGATRSNPIVYYANVNEATIIGAEFEARVGLDYIDNILDNFSVGMNLSLVHSQIDIASSELEQRRGIDPDVSSTRQLQGQSPFTLNIDLSYSNLDWGTTAGLYFNTFGERLSKVSANVTPDVFEQPAAQLNFTLSQKIIDAFYLNAGIKNILNSAYQEVYRYKGTDYIYQSYQTGVVYSIGLSYKL